MAFTRATKFESKLRMAIAGPAGAGKTWTALTIATALAEGAGVALIDTEHGSASKYADAFTFDTMELSNFNPANYVTAIKEAEAAGYAVLVIDSLSHAWNGHGGLLEILEGVAARKYNKNTFNAWKDVTPIQNAMIEAILEAKIHIIATLRSKMDHVQEKNERTNKTEVRKVGMAPIQRDGLEYEFDIVADMDIDNTMIIQKSRCPALSGQIIQKPDASVATILQEWLKGAPVSIAIAKPAQPAPVKSISRTEQAYQDGLKAGVFASRTEFQEFVKGELGEEFVDMKTLTADNLYDIELSIQSRIAQASNTVDAA